MPQHTKDTFSNPSPPRGTEPNPEAMLPPHETSRFLLQCLLPSHKKSRAPRISEIDPTRSRRPLGAPWVSATYRGMVI